jgi:hypothetical protein
MLTTRPAEPLVVFLLLFSRVSISDRNETILFGLIRPVAKVHTSDSSGDWLTATFGLDRSRPLSSRKGTFPAKVPVRCPWLSPPPAYAKVLASAA